MAINHLIERANKIKRVSFYFLKPVSGKWLFYSSNQWITNERATPKRTREQYNIQGINFLDLTFTANPQYTEILCKEIIKTKLNIKFWCESRVNIPLPLLDTMKKAGCVSLVIGVESGSPRIIKKVSKNITIEQVIKFCKKCKDLAIIVQPYFMFSHPDETEEDIKDRKSVV